MEHKKKLIVICGIVLILLVVLGIVIFYNSSESDIFSLESSNQNSVSSYAKEWIPLNITTSGLIVDDVDVTFNSNSINFISDNLDITLSPKEVLVPDELSDKTTLSGYTIQDAGYIKRILLTGLTYDIYSDYGNENVSDLLGWGGTNYISDYYPANYFQLGAYASDVVENESDLIEVFDYDMVQQQSNYNISWKIYVTSHYNHLVINYELWFTNSTSNDLVYSWENVYSDETTELLAINYQLNKYQDYSQGQIVDRALMRYDNLYGKEKYVNVTLAYPKNKTILEFFASSVSTDGNEENENITSISNFTEIENRYDSVVTKANELGKTETLIENTEDYNFKSYSVLVSENSENTFYFKIPSEYGEYNDLSIWVEGSFAGGSGTSGDPYQITNWTNLAEIEDDMTASYILMNDLNSSTAGYDEYASSSADSGAGWTPIGTFTGTFDGQNNTLSDLYINRGGTIYQGFFGYVQGAYISNIGVINITIVDAGDYSGGLAGRLDSGTIINSYATGNINGSVNIGGLVGRMRPSAYVLNSYSNANVNGTDGVGSLVGYAYSSVINNSYATGNINGSNAGGLLGSMQSSSIIENSYSIGNVTGSGNIGGLVGLLSLGTITNSYYDNETSGQVDTGKGEGKTTEDLQNIATFSPWDIVAVADENTRNTVYTWNIVNGSSYPFLSWEYTEASSPVDAEYPQFSNYKDNNASLIGSGDAWFNVTISHTNGTAFLEIDGTNYSASNISDVWNTTVSSLTGGTYPYYWGSWGNGTDANYNTSGIRYYTVNVSSSCTCPGNGNNWEIDLSDYCIITSPCDLGVGNITFTGTGNITFNADITACLIGDLPTSQKGYVGSNVNVSVGGCL